MFIIFFSKQKTAYEMRISDWSSDVCSSDLLQAGLADRQRPGLHRQPLGDDPAPVEHHEVELQGVESLLAGVFHHQVGPAGALLRLELVQLDADGLAAGRLRQGRPSGQAGEEAEQDKAKEGVKVIQHEISSHFHGASSYNTEEHTPQLQSLIH